MPHSFKVGDKVVAKRDLSFGVIKKGQEYVISDEHPRPFHFHDWADRIVLMGIEGYAFRAEEFNLLNAPESRGKFTVGDRVRVISDTIPHLNRGDEFVITGFDGIKDRLKFAEYPGYAFMPQRFEIVTTATGIKNTVRDTIDKAFKNYNVESLKDNLVNDLLEALNKGHNIS